MLLKPVFSTSLQSIPILFAIRTFLPRPNINFSIPSWTLSFSIFLAFISFCISVYFTIGPAISCGNKVTNVAKFIIFISGLILPLYTSML
ncbi:hypothetical protein CNEONATNEC26_01249 [Clostridium neonatale]|nr:hypothetical protein CNEONATNEC26_01249 [Clostridium neonatale]